MTAQVEYTDGFGEWWRTLGDAEQADVAAYVTLLEAHGVRLGFPRCSGINGSRHSHMRELRVQSRGRPIRVCYAFDPRRKAILLIGGDKTGDDRFYDRFVANSFEPAPRGGPDMTGRHSFDALRQALTPEQREAAETKFAVLQGEMSLAELRHARRLTQESLSATLHVGQAAVAKMEKRADMYVSNLRRFIEAMGGELQVVARFPEGEVHISNFAGLDALGGPAETERR